ncbi:hypothetical protein ETN89_20420 (plasmid) [Photobacterium damselae subsp. damselae]|uniref:hypothetical protein n=1 Tax=Photobacterium damselae TaxID=38293 RepID=UPI000A2FD879|nr:hypothetical protein [Photobacterium damselae]ARR51700.1 hypothetical protein CAY62_19915 [Photobacterium damselae subsp. damselae]ARR51849.1 hypothetical protein CAY62_20810 [Photobacterium damselae subsp. damselae]QAY37570.1 hypothetical protein ETN89_20180 [Photobacterium damselae subsp. damselae]QAY37609.1 hypothetical protein ETN89_20420 [Photobacterium damselae subsp. damselae]
MTKLLILATLFSAAAFANTQILNQLVQQGFSGPTHGTNSVKEALSAWVDTPVTLMDVYHSISGWRKAYIQ